MLRVLYAGVSAVALSALAGAALAADLPRRQAPPAAYKAPPVYSPMYNWTGFYVGINGGGAFGRSEWDSTGQFDLSGGLVGGTAGFNWQTGPWVFGIEGDADWSNIKGTTNAFCAAGCSTSNQWLATVRGRLGYAFDRFLPYITGGVAIGDVRARTPGFAGQSDTNFGWTAGGGIEFAIMGNWTAKAEYLYVDLGEINCGLNCGALVTDDVTFTSHIIRGGINYRF